MGKVIESKASAFSFGWNLINGGYPFKQAIEVVRDFVDDMVFVDCGSTDGTREALETMNVTIIDGQWGRNGGKTLADAHALHTACKHDTIIHFEADEVWDEKLLFSVTRLIKNGDHNIAVPRIQVEMNFQRIRWYPVPVHRVFPKGVTKSTVADHTTVEHETGEILTLSPDQGLIWDVQPPRDNVLRRIEQNAKLRKEDPVFRRVPEHFMHDQILKHKELASYLKRPEWTWKKTPFNIPDILKPLVGETKYA